MTSFGKSIMGGVIVLILIGGGYYFMRPDAGASVSEDTLKQEEQILVPPTQATTTEATGTQPTGKKMAFSQFLQQGTGPQMCTVNYTINNETSKGTVYTDGTKMHGEFIVNMKGQSITVTMLVVDGYTYTWNSMAPTMGFKIKNTVSTTESTEQPKTAGWDTNQVGDYTCEPWRAETSKFVPPATVTFSMMSN